MFLFSSIRPWYIHLTQRVFSSQVQGLALKHATLYFYKSNWCMDLQNSTTNPNYTGMLHMINPSHYNDVIMSATASQVTSLTIVYSIAYSGAHQRKHQSSASLAFVRGIHWWPVNSPHKGPVTRWVQQTLFKWEISLFETKCIFYYLPVTDDIIRWLIMGTTKQRTCR